MFYLPNPVLKLQVVDLKTGEFEFDSLLDFSLSYKELSPEDIAELAKLELDHPGYRLSRLSVTSAGAVHVSIPSLGISEDFNSLSGVEGPYFNESFFFNQDQTPTLKRLFHTDGFIGVTGQVSFTFGEPRSESFQAYQIKQGPTE